MIFVVLSLLLLLLVCRINMKINGKTTVTSTATLPFNSHKAFIHGIQTVQSGAQFLVTINLPFKKGPQVHEGLGRVRNGSRSLFFHL